MQLELLGSQVVPVQGGLLVLVGLQGVWVQLVPQVRWDSLVDLDCQDLKVRQVLWDWLDHRVSQVHEGHKVL